MRATIERIRAREQERRYLLAVLDLWAQAQEQGIAPEDVEAFGFAPEFLTAEEKRQEMLARRRQQPSPFTGKRLSNGHYQSSIHNYVRLKNGERVRLTPSLKAVYFEDFAS